MSDITGIPVVQVPTIPVRQAAPWIAFGVLLTVVFLYFVGAEQGATALIGGELIHEWVHDGRHLLGFPCH